MLTFLIASLAATPAGATLSEPLQPLSFLAGHCWKAPIAGGKQIDTHCFEPMHGGRHLRDRHEVADSSGKIVYGGETIYTWNGKTKRVEYAYFSSDGAVSYGSVIPKDGMLDFGDEIFNGADGKEIRISTLWSRVGDEAYDSISRSAFVPTGQRVVRYSLVK